ncbi:unnamed protein product [Pedinophyceae sp. YPF-701]|nr:unnamed protein product [Pedinophyceae sp. YPF-701]
MGNRFGLSVPRRLPGALRYLTPFLLGSIATSLWTALVHVSLIGSPSIHPVTRQAPGWSAADFPARDPLEEEANSYSTIDRVLYKVAATVGHDAQELSFDVGVGFKGWYGGFDVAGTSFWGDLQRACPPCNFYHEEEKPDIILASVYEPPQTIDKNGAILILFTPESLDWEFYLDWKREVFDLPAEETAVDFAFGYLPGTQRAKLLLAATFTFVQHHRPIIAHTPEWLGSALGDAEYVDSHTKPDASLIDGRNGQVALVARSDYLGFRDTLIEQLGKVAQVDCPSDLGHNMPSLDEQGLSKIDFFRNHLFCAVPENTQTPGYVSEKLFDAARAGCIPIYAGDVPPEPHVFNPDRIIFARTMDEDGAKDVAAQVEALLNDRAALEAKFALPIFRPGAVKSLTAMLQDKNLLFDAAVRLVLLRKLERVYAPEPGGGSPP